jgi:hypothetical protein
MYVKTVTFIVNKLHFSELIAICVLRAQSDTLSIEGLILS